MVGLERFADELPAPIETLERLLGNAGTSIVQAAFANSFFVHPNAVRARTPFYPDRARVSREHYPGKSRGKCADWQGAIVKLDGNSRAQKAWEKYTGRPVVRKSGYGVRHIWGNPWDPSAFTAGWNLCYMPFWIGMLTEDQHPHEDLQKAVKQASWDLFFAESPVCETPSFVSNPEFDLGGALRGQNIRLLVGGQRMDSIAVSGATEADIVRSIRSKTNQSWTNLRKGVRAILELPHGDFGTENVAASSKSVVRRMQRETGVALPRLKDILDSM